MGEDDLGLVHLYTGEGKGKSSAALGVALRALGHGLRVCVVQFAKATDVASGEVAAAQELGLLEIVRFGDSSVWGSLMPTRSVGSEGEEATAAALDYATKAVFSGEWDVVVLDEICVAIGLGLVEEECVLHLVGDKPGAVELVLTGRGASVALIDACDLVTEMRDVRHPIREGVGPRRGIEY